MTHQWIRSNSPGFAGAAIGMLIGVVLFGYGMWSFFEPVPPPLPQSFALLLAGFINVVCCYFTMRKIRVAWSFALALNGTGVLLFLFGAPKVRDAIDANLAIGFIPMLAFLLATALLALAADEFG